MAEPVSHIPRMMKRRGSPEFIGDTLRHLKTNWEKDLAFVVGIVEKTYADLQECQAWEKFPPGQPYGSEDAMLQSALGITLEEFLLRIGKAKRDQQTLVTAQKNPDPILPHGKNQHAGEKTTNSRIISSPEEEVINSEFITSSSGEEIAHSGPGRDERGTGASYRIRKLRRDHPAIAARLDAGEFKSVAAAERASRGEEPNPPRRQASPADRVLRLWDAASEEERRAILEALKSRLQIPNS